MPVACIGFIILQSSKKYLGSEQPSPTRNAALIAGMVLYTGVLTGFVATEVVTKGPAYVTSICAALSSHMLVRMSHRLLDCIHPIRPTR